MKLRAAFDVPQEDQILLKQIRQVVEDLDDVPVFNDEGHKIFISCHMLARAFAKFFPVQLRDGWYINKFYPHSWLVTKNSHIIDPYPWEMLGGPILLINHPYAHSNNLYIPDEKYRIPALFDRRFSDNVNKVIWAMGQSLERLGLAVHPAS